MSILIDPVPSTVPPENCTEREAAVYELLARLGITYTRVSHAPAMTIADCDDINAALGIEMCKNLLLCDRGQTVFFLVMLPGSRMFRSATLAAAVGAPRLSFAPGSVMEPLLGVSPGSLTVLALANDTRRRVRLVIDRALAASEYIGCHPCVNTSSLKLKTSDLLRVFLPYTRHKAEIVDLS
jgi:Ala-tRNA(Pro) deacylase